MRDRVAMSCSARVRAMAVLAALLGAPAATAADAPIELRAAMQDLLEWLPGSYSSAAQVYLEAASGAPPSGPHEQVYREISRIDAPQIGEFVLFSQVRRGGKSGPLPEAQPNLLVLEYDLARRAIAMSGRRIRDAGQFVDLQRRPADWSRVATDPAYGVNCHVLWRRHGRQLVGRVADAGHEGSCTMRARDGRTLRWETEWVLNPDELWLDDNGYDAGGRLFAGRADRAHLRLTKLRDYECFFVHQAPSGEPLVVNGPHLNDGGDTYVWALPGLPPRKVHFELLRGLWPSESGRNDEERLRLSLFEGEPDDGRKGRKLLGSGWAGAASDRAAFSSREFNGRCKRFDPAMPPPK